MKLFNAAGSILLEHNDDHFVMDEPWDILINRDNLEGYLLSRIKSAKQVTPAERKTPGDISFLPPIGQQEVWAAGVTYLKSRDARMEESHGSGAASLYDKVYDAERPELFFKAIASRVSGHKQAVYIRKDSAWNVPEPELTLFINSSGNIQGYTIGNDMSSRSIEGENALYLPQAKIYEKSAALGPCLYVTALPIDPETAISMIIWRKGNKVYDDVTAVSRLKRSFKELVTYLFAECDFPHGCFLMTGTCLVPSSDFTLQEDDIVEINIGGIGTLINTIACNPKHKSN
ncbi:MAG TPA: fumarylacetoacetate hydrolase family protein [Mucilaginibacter sp.]|jgi:2-dehydro-3-deoxy-D-arabinonate dehydratase|nr:fumarylacetoacetate hydrolase family protein [Mucilaginibacter sp.]